MAQYTSERARLNLLPTFSSYSANVHTPERMDAVMTAAETAVEPAASSSRSSPSTSQSVLLSENHAQGAPASLAALRRGTRGRRSLSTEATLVELDLEDGEKDGNRLTMLLDFGRDSSQHFTGTKRYRPSGNKPTSGARSVFHVVASRFVRGYSDPAIRYLALPMIPILFAWRCSHCLDCRVPRHLPKRNGASTHPTLSTRWKSKPREASYSRMTRPRKTMNLFEPCV
jgi:hypothetical protein